MSGNNSGMTAKKALSAFSRSRKSEGERSRRSDQERNEIGRDGNNLTGFDLAEFVQTCRESRRLGWRQLGNKVMEWCRVLLDVFSRVDDNVEEAIDGSLLLG